MSICRQNSGRRWISPLAARSTFAQPSRRVWASWSRRTDAACKISAGTTKRLPVAPAPIAPVALLEFADWLSLRLTACARFSPVSDMAEIERERDQKELAVIDCAALRRRRRGAMRDGAAAEGDSSRAQGRSLTSELSPGHCGILRWYVFGMLSDCFELVQRLRGMNLKNFALTISKLIILL